MFGEQYYHWNDPKNRGLIGKLYELYQQEVDMSYTFKDFRRDYTEELLKSLPAEEILKNLSPKVIEEYLAKLKAQEQPAREAQEKSLK